jgi:hypothetical protein
MFGKLMPITSIHAKQIRSKDGKMFMCFYQKFGIDATMSNSIHEGQSV